MRPSVIPMNARSTVPMLAACALLPVLGGCGVFGIASKVGEAIEVEKKVEVLAKYRGLENKTVAVLVNAERGPGNRWIWDGMAGATIGIVERDSLDPDAFVEEYSVSVKFPDVPDLSRESAQEEGIQTGLVAKFTQTVNKLFYDHLVDKYPNKRLKG
jgi:hypothetical protein